MRAQARNKEQIWEITWQNEPERGILDRKQKEKTETKELAACAPHPTLSHRPHEHTVLGWFRRAAPSSAKPQLLLQLRLTMTLTLRTTGRRGARGRTSGRLHRRQGIWSDAMYMLNTRFERSKNTNFLPVWTLAMATVRLLPLLQSCCYYTATQD